MAEGDVWVHGGVTYPLPAATTNPLLRDADPALFLALDYLAAVLERCIGPRLVAQAALEGLHLPGAVVQKLHVDPQPFLLADQLRFPTLAVYRKNETYSYRTVTWDQDAGEWEFAYVLPPLTPRQVEKVSPILRSAATVIRRAVERGHDSAYNAGEKVWATAGIALAHVPSVKYGGYEAISENGRFFRAIVGTMQMVERDMGAADLEELEGVELGVDVRAEDGTTVDDVVEISMGEAPTITFVSPATGPAAGGSLVAIDGTGFVVGTTPRVLFDGTDATDVVVESDTRIVCMSPAHAAYGALDADVAVVATDGQTSNVLEAIFTFTS